jgi:hypothetical protein
MSSRLIAMTVIVLACGVVGFGLGQFVGGETALTGAILGALICLVLK